MPLKNLLDGPIMEIFILYSDTVKQLSDILKSIHGVAGGDYGYFWEFHALLPITSFIACLTASSELYLIATPPFADCHAFGSQRQYQARFYKYPFYVRLGER